MVVAPAVAGPWLGGWVSGWVDCGLYLSCFILYIYIDWFIYIYILYTIYLLFSFLPGFGFNWAVQNLVI